MTWGRAQRAVILLLLLVVLLGLTTLAWGQFASKTGDSVGTIGGTCNSSANTYGWPDGNGDILKCVSNVWTLVTMPTSAGGSNGQVQFNSSGALAGSANLFWNNGSTYLGIGTNVPDNTLSLGGQSAQTIDMVRETTASTAGNNLTVQAGGAISGGTDLSGGNLVLSSGISTGTHTSNVQFQTYPAAASTSSSDNAADVALTVSATGLASSGQGTLATTLQSSAGSGTDKNGGALTLASGVSTGTGTSNMNFRVYGAGSTGSTANAAITAVTIASTGNVGIGTTNPGQPLDVRGTAAFGTLGQQLSIVPNVNGSWINLPAAAGSAIGNGGAGSNPWIAYVGTGNTYFTGSLSGDIAYRNTGGRLLFGTSSGNPNLVLSGSNIGINTTAPDNALSLGGQSAQIIDMVRETTASTAGNNLTLQAGGAKSGGTDLLGGNLVLSSGISTGTSTSNVQFQTYPAAASTSSSDNAADVALTLSATGLASSGQGTLATTLQSTAGSGTDKNGGALTLASGVSTGTGTSSMNFKVYGAGSTGSTANSAATAMTIASTGNVGIGTTLPQTGVALDLGNNTAASNSSLLLPGGSTANRPNTGIAGMLRYNSTIAGLEGYYNSAWNTLLSTTTGGSTIPAAGSGGQVQYNSGNFLGGAAGLAYATSGRNVTVLAQNSTDTPLLVQGCCGGTLGSGIVSYWKFDEDTGVTLGDSAGSNTGTFQGTAGSQWVTAKINFGLGLNGSNNYVSTANSISLPTSFTISVWFKTSTASGHKITGFENTQTGVGSSNYDSQIWVGTDGKLRYGENGCGCTATITSSGTVTDGSWHHAVAIENAGAMTLYLDGSSQGTASSGAQTTTGYWRIGSYRLGGWASASDGYFTGNIDEVAIWNRALTSTEVTSLYNSGAGNQYPFSGSNNQSGNLADFETNTGTILAYVDSSGNFSTTGTLSAISTITGSALIPAGTAVPSNGMYLPASNTIGFATNTTGAMWISSSGKVGIGTTAPQSALHVNGGEVQIGSSGASCTSNIAGAMRYSSGLMYYCNGSAWLPFSLSCFGSSSAGSDTSLASGLVAYWNFNENTGSLVYDDSGNGYNGAWSGTLGSQWTTGIINSGGNFDGSTNAVNTAVIPNVTSPLTVSAWVYPTSVSQFGWSGGQGATIIDENENGQNQGWEFGINNSNKLWFWPSGGNDRFSTGTVPNNTWTHIVVTYDGTNLRVYFNGSLDSTQSMPAPQGSATLFRIGGKAWVTGYWEGRIDEVGIWNVALTGPQVSTLYNSGGGNVFGAFVCPVIVNSSGGFAN